MIFELKYTLGTADPFTITITNTMKNEKFQTIFGLWYTRGTAKPFTITILKKKGKISHDFWVEVTRRGTTDPFTITSLKTMKNEKFQMIFGLRYTRGNSWSLHDHQPKNHEKWKISNDFWVEVHAGVSWSLHDHQPKNHEKWKISNDFWVEVHAGNSWSLHDHQPKNHEKMKNFKWFLGWGTRGGQLISSRSPS